jgi:outer membrane protein TolC
MRREPDSHASTLKLRLDDAKVTAALFMDLPLMQFCQLRYASNAIATRYSRRVGQGRFRFRLIRGDLPAGRGWLAITLLLGVLLGCRTGKQVHDPNYFADRVIGQTQWCSHSTPTNERLGLDDSLRPSLIGQPLRPYLQPHQLAFQDKHAHAKSGRTKGDSKHANTDWVAAGSLDNDGTRTGLNRLASTRRNQDFQRTNSYAKKKGTEGHASSEVELTSATFEDEDQFVDKQAAESRTQDSTATQEESRISETAEVIKAAEPAGAVPSEAFDLSSLIRAALANNPDIAVAQREIEIACAKIPQVGSLADPMVDVIGWPITSNAQQTAGGRMTAEIMLSQEVPWRGKLESRVAQAAGEVRRLRNQRAAIELKIANQIKQAWYDDWLVEQKIEISKTDANFLNELLERAEVLYEGGQVGQRDILRLQSEIGLNVANLASLEAEKIEARAELLRVLNWPVEQELLLVPSACEMTPDNIPDRAAALAQATAASPELQAILAEVQRDQWKVTESRLNYYPDLKFSAGWGGMTTRNALAPTADGIDNLIAGVSFNLPVRLATRDAALRESESQVVKGIRNWEQSRNQTERDVVRLHAALVSLMAQLKAYQTEVVPRLSDALELAQAAYEVNKSDLSDLINLRREILRLKESAAEFKARWYQARADLSLLIAEVDW